MSRVESSVNWFSIRRKRRRCHKSSCPSIRSLIHKADTCHAVPCWSKMDRTRASHLLFAMWETNWSFCRQILFRICFWNFHCSSYMETVSEQQVVNLFTGSVWTIQVCWPRRAKQSKTWRSTQAGHCRHSGQKSCLISGVYGKKLIGVFGWHVLAPAWQKKLVMINLCRRQSPAKEAS